MCDVVIRPHHVANMLWYTHWSQWTDGACALHRNGACAAHYSGVRITHVVPDILGPGMYVCIYVSCAYIRVMCAERNTHGRLVCVVVLCVMCVVVFPCLSVTGPYTMHGQHTCRAIGLDNAYMCVCVFGSICMYMYMYTYVCMYVFLCVHLMCRKTNTLCMNIIHI